MVKDDGLEGTDYTEAEKELRFQEFKAIAKVTEDVRGTDGNYGLNTAVSSIMEYVNAMHAYVGANKTIHKAVALEANKNLLKLLAPFTPHITEELWQKCGFEAASMPRIGRKSTNRLSSSMKSNCLSRSTAKYATA